MRTRCTILLLLAAISILAADRARAAAVGAVLGLGREGISGDAPANTSYGAGIGLIAGLQGEIALGQGVALSVQPMFSQRRTTLTAASDQDPSGETSLDLKMDYVSVPVVVKFATSGGRTYVAGGADLAWLQSARVTGQGLDQDVESRFHGVDVGALIGFGVVFPVGRHSLTTELRYVQGLTNLSDGGGAGAVTGLPERFHSSGLQLTAGILLPIGKP
jgi:hypothetical protein